MVFSGTFVDGKAVGKVDPDIGEIEEMRIRVLEELKNWVILSNVSKNPF